MYAWIFRVKLDKGLRAVLSLRILQEQFKPKLRLVPTRMQHMHELVELYRLQQLDCNLVRVPMLHILFKFKKILQRLGLCESMSGWYFFELDHLPGVQLHLQELCGAAGELHKLRGRVLLVEQLMRVEMSVEFQGCKWERFIGVQKLFFGKLHNRATHLHCHSVRRQLPVQVPAEVQPTGQHHRWDRQDHRHQEKIYSQITRSHLPIPRLYNYRLRWWPVWVYLEWLRPDSRR